MRPIDALGRWTLNWVDSFGDFCRFSGMAMAAAARRMFRWRMIRLSLVQMFEVGTRSLPVVMVTGAFVGMVLAVQAVVQFKSVGMEGQLGAIVNMSVLRELGPVLTGILLAGRVGGAMTAELGTMKVTEQLDALRAMGVNPVVHLVAPRFLALSLLGPLLVIYADLMGMLGGYYVSVFIYNVNGSVYWMHAAGIVEFFDISMGLIKSLLFGAAISLICCYKAFRCGPGAAGVGRACTEAFVISCMVILAQDFFLNVLLGAVYQMLYGVKQIIG